MARLIQAWDGDTFLGLEKPLALLDLVFSTRAAVCALSHPKLRQELPSHLNVDRLSR